MVEGDNAERPTYVWTRWDEEGEGQVGDEGLLPLDNPLLHDLTVLFPFVESAEEESTSESDVEIRFLPEPFRWGLRHTPLLVLFWLVAFVLGAELTPSVGGVSTYLPSIPTMFLLGGGSQMLVWLVLAWLFVSIGLLETRDLLKGAIVFGLLAVLGLGTAFSFYLVTTATNPRMLEPNIVYTSGYLLMLLITGSLLYDGMLRLENLFEDLDQKLIVPNEPVIEEAGVEVVEKCSDGTDIRTKEDAYRRFKERLAADLTHDIPVPGTGWSVRTIYLIAPLFLSQFVVVWIAQSGPQGLDFWVTLVGNVFLDLFIVAAAFQFLLLTENIHKLVNDEFELEVRTDDDDGDDDGDDEPETRQVSLLDYQPFHPDGRGGFRDLGKFALHINLILIVGGLFVVYRLYVQGARTLPMGQIPTSIDPSLAAAVWMVSYIVPLVAYVLATGAWLYYSFWHLHLKMARERERQYIRKMIESRREGSRSPPIGTVEDRLDWIEFRNAAPVWPVKSTQLTSVVSGTLAPLVLSLPKVF